MDQTNDLMRKLKLAGVILLSLLSVFVFVKILTEFRGLSYIGKSDQYTGTISVSGKGEVIAVPDLITFSFGVTEESPVVTTAQTQATEKMNKIIKFIRDQGVSDKDIKTTNYNIYPRYEYQTRIAQPVTPIGIDLPDAYYYPSNSGKQVLAAYVVTQTVEVRVRKTEDAGKLLTGIGEFGAVDISGLNFSVDKFDDLVEEAREKAISEARDNAKKLASDLGVKLVRITSYYDQGGNTPIYYARAVSSEMGMGGDMQKGAPAPELPAGENKIISNVTITYEIR